MGYDGLEYCLLRYGLGGKGGLNRSLELSASVKCSISDDDLLRAGLSDSSD